MNKPLIGITCNTIKATDLTVKMGIAAPGQDFQGLAVDYLDMIERAGGIPVILPITRQISDAEALWSSLDGLLLSGGGDVSPGHYGERISKECGVLDYSRDNYEIAAVQYAVSNSLPILGICRGSQLLNIALGGSCYQDLLANGFEQHTLLNCRRNEWTHRVRLEKDSLLFEIFQREELEVNSFHHQAIHTTPPSLEIMAHSEDDVVEAVRVKNHPFAVAVQWHPEMMFDSTLQLKLACAFVQACLASRKCP